MCGIGGKLSFDEKPTAGLGEEMNACMRHRGPDAEGIYANGPAMLAHRRLSILDLSDAGRQPMSTDDGSIHIVFNGEIYNYRELRGRLSQYSFSSETDTEVLLKLYREEGIDCLELLRGMFAFAIWDEREDRLFLARDRLGQKPLFFRSDNGTFWFGSTIKTILADEQVPARPDQSAIRQYLTYQYVPHPLTGFEGIRQLRPAEYAVVDETGLQRESYWSVSFADQSSASPASLAAHTRDKLRESTRLRMRSDVPVGVFLSGGIDSSIVTYLMDDVSDTRIDTYSIGFDEYDELSFARDVAGAYDTNHHEYTVTPDSMAVLPELVAQYEMPFGDPSALPTYYVSKVASEDATVVLTGDAGDENFAGYDRYTYDKIAYWLSKIPEQLRETSLRSLAAVPGRDTRGGGLRYARRGLEAADSDPIQRYANFICHASDTALESLWDGPVPDGLTRLRRAFEETDGPTHTDRLMHLDILTYLPDDLLVKVDRASMAHSLEVRSPFLDHKFVEFAAEIPSKFKWRYGEKKWLLKRAFRDVLPDSILTRSKQGFSVPVDAWFRGELREFARERLDRIGTRKPFNSGAIDSLFADHVGGEANNGYRLWDLVILAEWYDQFIE